MPGWMYLPVGLWELISNLGIKYSDVQRLEMTTKTMAAVIEFGANIEVLTFNQGYFDSSHM
jgi:hypothetical protein